MKRIALLSYLNELPMLSRHVVHPECLPYVKGLNVLYNLHFDKCTVGSACSMKFAGAENVHVTLTEDLEIIGTSESVQQNLELLELFGIPFIEPEYLETSDNFYDIVVTAGDKIVSFLGNTPSMGYVELTRSGYHGYIERDDFESVVIDVDGTNTKKIETKLGTGNGFTRSLYKLLDEFSLLRISNGILVICGAGKVGQGIALSLSKTFPNSQIFAIDKDISALEEIKKIHPSINTLLFSGQTKTDTESELFQLAKSADLFVTATGENNLLTNIFGLKPEDISASCVLANMGHDKGEIGFVDDRVLWGGKFVNFSLERPTLFRYLDPVFDLLGRSVSLMAEMFFVEGNVSPGIYPVPKDLDDEVVGIWEMVYGESF